MALINLDLIGQLAINQRYEWRVSLMFQGRFFGSFQGQVWADFDGPALAAFAFGVPRYDEATDQTRVEVSLNPRQTQEMPLTGPVPHVYNITVIQSGKQPKLLMAGFVQVLPTIPL